MCMNHLVCVVLKIVNAKRKKKSRASRLARTVLE